MSLRPAFALVAALALGHAAPAATRPDDGLPAILIDAAAPARWTIAYRVQRPVRELVFARSPDASRGTDWSAPAGFEFGADDRGEFVRRRDRAPFVRVDLSVPTAYRDLAKDYAPFSPFGDGGMAFHSGRFFACPKVCPDDARFAMAIRVGRGRHLILDGRRHTGSASWTDGENGRSVYVGEAMPVATPDVMALVDDALPARVRARLDADLPRFMHYFAERLGAMPERPALFVSYDTGHAKGWGRQGGTLPGQVFVHFYGAAWTAEMAKPGFDFDLAWHLAHEASHIHQRGLQASDPGASWIHEGAAEAFAAIATRALDAAAAPEVEARIAAARTQCADGPADVTLARRIDGGDFPAAYSCGLLMSLALDQAAQAYRPGSDGLFAIWRSFIANAPAGRRTTRADYDRAVSDAAGPCAAEAIAKDRVAAVTIAAIEACARAGRGGG